MSEEKELFASDIQNDVCMPVTDFTSLDLGTSFITLAQPLSPLVLESVWKPMHIYDSILLHELNDGDEKNPFLYVAIVGHKAQWVLWDPQERGNFKGAVSPYSIPTKQVMIEGKMVSINELGYVVVPTHKYG